MRRKNRKGGEEAPENHERWLVSYADYMTLLFALFVVLYAFAQTDKGKSAALVTGVVSSFQDIGLVSHSVGSPIFEGGIGITGSNATTQAAKMDIRPIHQKPVSGQQSEELDNKFKMLKSMLKGDLGSGQLELEKLGNQIVIRIKSHLMFADNSEYVQPKFTPLVQNIARALAVVPGQITVVGHTDATDPTSELFRNNWDLSALRAVSVANIILKDRKVDPHRLLVQGAADTRPTSKDAKDNRRVEIFISQGSAIKGKDTSPESVLAHTKNAQPKRPETT